MRKNQQEARGSRRVGHEQLLIAVALLLAMSLMGCSATKEISSLWNDNKIIVDGSQSDWGSETVYLEDEGLTLGVKNDQEFLYVCIVSQERRFPFQMALFGFTLWVESKTDDDRMFGLRFPLGTQDLQASRTQGSVSFDEVGSLLDNIPDGLEIVGPTKDDRIRLLKMEAQGIQVQLKEKEGLFVYEARVPLEKSPAYPHAIGLGDAKSISVGLEMGELNLEDMRERFAEGRSGAPPPGGRADRMPGGGGRARGGSPGAPGPLEGSRPERLNIKVEVKLASSTVSTVK